MNTQTSFPLLPALDFISLGCCIKQNNIYVPKQEHRKNSVCNHNGLSVTRFYLQYIEICCNESSDYALKKSIWSSDI